jgi:hypothetical protein
VPLSFSANCLAGKLRLLPASTMGAEGTLKTNDSQMRDGRLLHQDTSPSVLRDVRISNQIRTFKCQSDKGNKPASPSPDKTARDQSRPTPAFSTTPAATARPIRKVESGTQRSLVNLVRSGLRTQPHTAWSGLPDKTENPTSCSPGPGRTRRVSLPRDPVRLASPTLAIASPGEA